MSDAFENFPDERPCIHCGAPQSEHAGNQSVYCVEGTVFYEPSAPPPLVSAGPAVTDEQVETFCRTLYAADATLGYEGWDDFSSASVARLRPLVRSALEKSLAAILPTPIAPAGRPEADAPRVLSVEDGEAHARILQAILDCDQEHPFAGVELEEEDRQSLRWLAKNIVGLFRDRAELAAARTLNETLRDKLDSAEQLVANVRSALDESDAALAAARAENETLRLDAERLDQVAQLGSDALFIHPNGVVELRQPYDTSGAFVARVRTFATIREALDAAASARATGEPT